jgi:hypothetical protein
MTLQELLGANEHKQELLQAIWQAFLVLSEHCMKVRTDFPPKAVPSSCSGCASSSTVTLEKGRV